MPTNYWNTWTSFPGWPDSVKTMQRNWIGRSEGIELSFDVEGEDDTAVRFSRPGRIPCWVSPIWPSPRNIRWHKKQRQTMPDIAVIYRRVHSNRRQPKRRSKPWKRRACRSVSNAVHPISGEPSSAVGRQFRVDELRHWRGYGRARTRRTGLGIRRQARSSDHAGDYADGRIRDRHQGRALRGVRHRRQFR